MAMGLYSRGPFSKSDLERLMGKIPAYGSMSECLYLYRNKSRSYFDDILNDDGIMRPYLKDNSGDPRNPINGKIDGLFFMASVCTENGLPISDSPFGQRRCLIPVDELIRPETHNLYFSDFFCMRGRRHYVTLVVTRKGSSTDQICSRLLPQLDMENNRLFKYDSINRKFYVYTYGQYLLVELCYTEDVPIRNATFKDVPIAGKGSSTPGGLRKNPSCSTCNLLSPYRFL